MNTPMRMNPNSARFTFASSPVSRRWGCGGPASTYRPPHVDRLRGSAGHQIGAGADSRDDLLRRPACTVEMRVPDALVAEHSLPGGEEICAQHTEAWSNAAEYTGYHLL